MSTPPNRRLTASLAILSDTSRGVRPKPEDLEELRLYASDSEKSLPPDELACALVQRELDEYRANRIRHRSSMTASAA